MTKEQNNIPQIPSSWAWTKVGEIAEINPKLPKNDIPYDMEISFLPMRAVEERTGKFDLSIIKRYSEVRKGYTRFIDGDIIFAKITPCMENGKVALVNNLKNGMGFGSTEFHVIRLIDNNFLKDYVFYYLLQERFRNEAKRHMTGTVGQLRVPKSFMDEAPIPLPSFSEQNRIVSKIEELFTRLDAGVESLKKVKAQLQSYRQAVLKHAFQGKLTEEWRKIHKHEIEPAVVLLERIKEERKKKEKGRYRELPLVDTLDLQEIPESWVLTSVLEVSYLVTKGATPTTYGFPYLSQGINFVRVENMVKGRISRQSINKFITEEAHNFLKRAQLIENDVLFSIAGTIGRVAVVHQDDLPANINQAIAIIRCPWQFVAPYYLSFLFQSPITKLFIEKRPRGVGMNNISLRDVKNIIFPFAPLSEQHKIIEEIETRFSVADEVDKVVDQNLLLAERFRQSLLKKVFEGRLIPQDPSDEPAEKLLERIKEEKEKRNYKETRKKRIKSKREGSLKQAGLNRYVK